MSDTVNQSLGENVRVLPGAHALLDLIAQGRFATPAAHSLRLQAERMALMAGYDVLACVDTLPFTPFDYQVRAAQAALRRFRGRGLLCDEVGLGKTIEAGLVMGIDLALYNGQMTTAEKNEAIHRFEREGRVLLSTEAAGEGRNLQFCRTMANFGLPWNPQRIEQRVGRIHRVGQTRPVEIFNLSAEGSVEDYILDILDRKLNMFEPVIGEMETILGQLADARDFEDIVMDLWAGATTPDDAARRFGRLGDELVEAREAYRRARDSDEALFGEDLAAQ